MPPVVPRIRPTTADPIAVLTDREGIGDILMKMPFLRWIRHAFPEQPIWWIAAFETAMETLMRPYGGEAIARVIANAGHLGPAAQVRPRLAAMPRFSFVFDTRTRAPSIWLARKVLRFERYFTMLPFYLFSAARPPGRLQRPARRWARVLSLAEQAIGARLDPRGVLPCAREAFAAAETILPAGPRYVGIGPGSREERRNWPTGRFLDLARVLSGEGLTPLILVGPYEEEMLQPDDARARGLRIIRLGDFPTTAMFGPIDPALALCSRLSAMVANDAGMGHMAGAMGVPVVSLFGPTDANKQAPFCPDGIIVRASDFGKPVMESIPVDAVQRAVMTLLNRPPEWLADATRSS
jgi:ADP-heptose:LPS heptosyltransferase